MLWKLESSIISWNKPNPICKKKNTSLFFSKRKNTFNDSLGIQGHIQKFLQSNVIYVLLIS